MFSSSYSVFSFWIQLHCLFAALFLFAFVAGVIWIARFSTKKSLKTIAWTSLIVSILGVLLTAPMTYQGMREMMDWRFDDEVSSDEVTVDEDDENFESMSEIREEMMDFSGEGEVE